MSRKKKVPLTSQQVAREERALRRKTSRLKLQEILVVSTNSMYNCIPSLCCTKFDERTTSPKLVKHLNLLENLENLLNI